MLAGNLGVDYVNLQLININTDALRHIEGAIAQVRSAADSITYAGSLAMAVVPAPISQLPGMWRYNGAVNEALGFRPVAWLGDFQKRLG